VTDIARWIEREVARGLQGLVALRLPGAPGEDAVTLTLDIWLAALATRTAGWAEVQDAPRLQAAFRALYAQSHRLGRHRANCSMRCRFRRPAHGARRPRR